MDTTMYGTGLILALSLAACTADLGPAEDPSASEVGLARSALSTGWTNFTSEEYPPITCDGASAFAAVQCRGDNCDDVAAYCQPISGASRGDAVWTDRFSEEGTNYQLCPSGAWVTGLACYGDDCDDVSLQCSYLSGVSPTNCYWTGWVSEENGGTLWFGTDHLARGAQCQEDNCDNMRFYVCDPQ